MSTGKITGKKSKITQITKTQVNKIIRKIQKVVKNQERFKKIIILENWGQPGPEAICTQAAALRYAIRVHLKHLDQFENAKKLITLLL